MLSEELGDTHGQATACHGLGYAHYCLGDYEQAIDYYNLDLDLSSSPSPSSSSLHLSSPFSPSRDKRHTSSSSVCRAYCNLGLAHKALGNLSKSLHCQHSFLAHAGSNVAARFCALGNIGDVLLAQERGVEALSQFEEQLRLARDTDHRGLEAGALENIGSTNRRLGRLDAALASHAAALQVFSLIADRSGESRVHGSLGTTHALLGDYETASRCFDLQRAQCHDCSDVIGEAQAYGNIGIGLVNVGRHGEAIDAFQQQLGLLEQSTTRYALSEGGKAYRNLADCYNAVGDSAEAVRCLERCLAHSDGGSTREQCAAYQAMAVAHQAAGCPLQALVCLEKRLVIAHTLGEEGEMGRAYGQLGCLHNLLGNYEQAIGCLLHQLGVARRLGDVRMEGEASCALGAVYQDMGEFDKALEMHLVDLEGAITTKDELKQCKYSSVSSF